MRRSLQRQWKRSLAGLALLLALGQAPALAATINVGGACTLARAIVSANNDLSRFCTPGRGPDTIVLPARSTQTLTTVNNTNYGASGLPTIRSTITIVGSGATIIRPTTAPAFRIFALGNPSNLTLQNITVSGGRATRSRGGGVLANINSTLTLINSTISGNTAGDGGGLYIDGGSTLNAFNSTISRNTASYSGGGLYVDFNYPDSGAIANLNYVTIARNAASYDGGGIYASSDASVTLTL
jgi:hypothetical protein